MRTITQKNRARAGWRTGAAEDFLGLKAEETALVNMRLSLAEKLRGRRLRLGLSQTELARRLGSSQSRVAKMEAGEADVSLDLLVRGMLATGAKRGEVGSAIAAA